jgi:hypothetical protein
VYLKARRRSEREVGDDSGIAMITVILALAVVATIGTVGATLAVRSTQSSGLVQLSGQVTDLSNAGLAQGVSYLQTNSLATLTATSDATAETVTTAEGSYVFWVEPIAPWPDNTPAVYRVHSTGLQGTGAREATVDVSLTPFEGVPFGVFGRNVALGGSSVVVDQSVFSTGCIGGRAPGSITGTDLYRGIPAAAHSSNHVSETNQQPSAPVDCPRDESIHNGAAQQTDPFVSVPCNLLYQYDHDNGGGPVGGTPCDGLPVENTSLIQDKADLLRMFGLSEGLTAEQVEALEEAARSQGNYTTSASPGIGWYGFGADPAHSVYFYDLEASDGRVDLKDFAGSRWVDTGSGTCDDESLVIVIKGASGRFNGNIDLRASVFLIPKGGTAGGDEGDWDKGNGTAGLIGNLSGDDVDLRGNGEVRLDECAVATVSPALFVTRTENYRELDN